jgi:hypothetical protein
MALSEDGGTLFVSGTQNKMYKYAVGPQGLTLEQTATLSTLGNFVVAQGRLMTSSGEVYDTATWARLGLLRPLAGTLLLAPVPEMKRIWATSGIGGGPVAIYTHSTRIRSVLPPG